MLSNGITRRIAALQKAIRPRVSWADGLSAVEREHYERWKADRAVWSMRFDNPGDEYAASLQGDEGPELPACLRKHVSAPSIFSTDTEQEAQGKYQNVMERKL